MKKINVADIITYALLGIAIALCAVGAYFARAEVPALIVCILAGGGFLGVLVGLVVVRVKFWTGFNYWTSGWWGTRGPRIGFRGTPCWEREKVEPWIEAVIQFWNDPQRVPLEGGDGKLARFGRGDIEDALDGIVVWCRRDPWSSFGRMVVGVAGHEGVAVVYERDIGRSALAHELGHVIIGKLTGDWNEESSHKTMRKAGFTNAEVMKIVDGLP